jgi:hypothetical protein
VQNNQNAALINAGKFLDFGPYLNQPDPYLGGKPWRDAVNLDAMLATESPANKVYDLNLEQVQVLWFYNKEIFTATRPFLLSRAGRPWRGRPFPVTGGSREGRSCN